MRRDYRGSRGKLHLGTVSKTLSRGPCWANQEANLLERLVVHISRGINIYDKQEIE
jgi:hypothetical protein